MKGWSGRSVSAWILVAFTSAASGQSEAPLPPRIIDTQPPPEPPSIVDTEPGEARLAELPEDREAVLEEIVVIGQDRWRLPDLGASWRLQNEAIPETRLAVRYLPLYDPELAERMPDLFLLNKQEERAGYIELFRIRFGAVPQRTIVPTVTNPDP